jgi:PTH1 family peptidyl-tRNA hydrolase
LIVGLGNPGRHYRMNRHNAGFMLVDRLVAEFQLKLDRSMGNALLAVGESEHGSLVLAKPQTYVNESGRSVAALVRSFEIQQSDLLVAFDDLDLPLGSLRMRSMGGTSGHRGMRSIINHLGDRNFPRLRLGIGRPPGRMDAARYVLGDFSTNELAEMEVTFDRAADCVRKLIEADIQLAMNECNRANEPIDTP